MIRQFQSHQYQKSLIQSCIFSDLNEFLLDSFTRVLHRKPNLNPAMDPVYPFNKTPFIFTFKLPNDKCKTEINDVISSHVNKIDRTLNIYVKPLDWYIYSDLNTKGTHLMFRNWINGQQESKINALTIIEKVSEYPEDEFYYKKINEPTWYPSLKSFESYKTKNSITQIIDGNRILIE
jgi:hypothetical protein